MPASEQLAAIGARLKVEAPLLRKELLRGLKTGAAPLVPIVKAAAAEKLPKAGGLAAIVAGQKISTSVSLSPKSASVKLKSTKARGNRQSDEGYVRHPVFGTQAQLAAGFAAAEAAGARTKHGQGWKWVTQQIPGAAGWWSETLKYSAPIVTPELIAVMEQITARLNRGI